MSQQAMLCTGSHDRHDPGFEHTNVGEHAVVGAGVVVGGSIAPSTVIKDNKYD